MSAQLRKSQVGQTTSNGGHFASKSNSVDAGVNLPATGYSEDTLYWDRVRVASDRHTPDSQLAAIVQYEDEDDFRAAVAGNYAASGDTISAAVQKEKWNSAVYRAALRNPNTGDDTLAFIAGHASDLHSAAVRDHETEGVSPMRPHYEAMVRDYQSVLDELESVRIDRDPTITDAHRARAKDHAPGTTASHPEFWARTERAVHAMTDTNDRPPVPGYAQDGFDSVDRNISDIKYEIGVGMQTLSHAITFVEQNRDLAADTEAPYMNPPEGVSRYAYAQFWAARERRLSRVSSRLRNIQSSAR